jgi:NAD(P)H dehydrogenase (quinone)
MTKIALTGASGDLGRRVTAILAERLGAENLVLITRSPDGLDARRAEGAQVRFGDFDDPASLEAAFAGVGRLFIISGLAINRRVQQHRNAIAAARKAGVGHIVYSSTAGIHPANPTLSAKEHIVTEDDLRASGIDFTVLRDATYAEIVATLMIAPALATGKWEQVGPGGALAPVSKDDIAACAAESLLDPERHRGAVYEITGPELLSFADMAAIASEVHGVAIEYVPISEEQAYARFDAMGIPRDYQEGMQHAETHAWPSSEMVSASVSMAQNFHAVMTRHVEFITGRPAKPLRAVMQDTRGTGYSVL